MALQLLASPGAPGGSNPGTGVAVGPATAHDGPFGDDATTIRSLGIFEGCSCLVFVLPEPAVVVFPKTLSRSAQLSAAASPVG